MPNLCSMKDCTSSGRHDKLRSFYGFPQDPERSKVWVEACGNEELKRYTVEHLYKNCHVCDLHFKRSDRNRKKLKANVTPFPYDQMPMETKSTQTDVVTYYTSDSDIDIDNHPGSSTASSITKTIPPGKGARTKSQLKKLQEKLRRLQDDNCGLRSELFKLIDLQTELHKLTSNNQYTEKLRLYALNLYLACPKTYNILRMSLSLPSAKILRRNNLEIDTAMSCHVIQNLKSKMSSLKKTDRYCTVCIKKMPLKRFLFYHINRDKVIGFCNIDGKEIMEPATEVSVLMARGLNAKWEQPLAYCFLGDNEDRSYIDFWLNSVLDTLFGIGFDVVAMVVDHENLYNHFRNRIHSFSQPYIYTSRLDRKIYCIFDLPQLIISLRNTLMAHKLQFQDDDGSLVIADWGTLETLYSKTDVDSNGVQVPKLTKSHIHPNESEKKELKYAVEVFSKSVSEALEMDSKRRAEYDYRIRGTQILTALVNDVFDILNSSALNHHNKCKNAFTGEPYQMRAIRKFMEFLTNVKPLNDLDIEDTSFNCIYGLRITIMSFSIILRDLLPKGIKSLVTHRFNLDAVDRFFDFVRQKSKSEKPTAVQFYKYFRLKFIIELLKHPKTDNPADNLRQFLSRIDFRQITRGKMRSDDFKKTIEVETVDYRFELPTSNCFHFVCWYLLKKCYEVHNQSTCERLSRLLHNTVLGINWKLYNWDSPFKPPDTFIDFIKILDERFNKNFGNRLEIGLGTGILLMLKDLKFELICPCFPINYVRRLFVRLRIFNIIRYNNRRLCDESFSFSSTDHYNIDIL